VLQQRNKFRSTFSSQVSIVWGTRVVSVAARWADWFVLRPSRDELDFGDQSVSEITTRFGRVQVFRRLVNSQKGGKPQIRFLKAPGTAGRAERSTDFPAQLVENLAGEVITWNPPGYGASTGQASLASLVPALAEVYDYLNEENMIPTIGVGNSLGCCSIMGLATVRKLAGLVLRNPPPIIDMCQRRNHWWNMWRGGSWIASAIPSELDSVQTAAKVSCPALFIHSLQDTFVPVSLQNKIADRYASAKQQIFHDESDHDTPLTESHLRQLKPAMQWLIDHCTN
jgi:uncharacterized protein